MAGLATELPRYFLPQFAEALRRPPLGEEGVARARPRVFAVNQRCR